MNPLKDDEFQKQGIRTCKQVQTQYFLDMLPFDQGGRFYYKRRALSDKTQEGTVVLFQCGGSIIASATYLERGQSDKRGYAGFMQFNPKSIRVFRPVNADLMKVIFPKFKRFGNVPLSLETSKYPDFDARLAKVRTPVELLRDDDAGESDYVASDDDLRRVVYRQIKERRGQQRFRNELLKRYDDRCMVTGCEAVAVLEAAHIDPYLGEHHHHSDNGLLLRADIHTLFDLDLFGIEPGSLTVRFHPSVYGAYAKYNGRKLECGSSHGPSEIALEKRYIRFCKKV